MKDIKVCENWDDYRFIYNIRTLAEWERLVKELHLNRDELHYEQCITNWHSEREGFCVRIMEKDNSRLYTQTKYRYCHASVEWYEERGYGNNIIVYSDNPMEVELI